MALPTVNATRVHVVNLDTDDVYYTKGSGTLITASLAKLMTVHVVRQIKTTGASLDQSVTIQSSDLTPGGTGQNIDAGDVLTIRELLANALLPSSNNSCQALARVIGQEFLDAESGGVGDPIARFMDEVDAAVTALGLTNTSLTDPHGFNTTSISTPEDINLIWPALRNDTELRSIWFWSGMRINSISTISNISSTVWMMGDAGIFAGKTGSNAGVYNLSVLWEAPNGQVVAVTVMGCNADSARFSDARSIIAQLLVDYPALASPGTPWTPATMFDALMCGGGWWDASDTGTLWQDTSATTAVTANNDPVARWDSKAGTAGAYWRQSGATARPLWKNSDGSLQFDGTNDFLDLGGPSVGGTGLFASGANAWIAVVKLKTTDAAGAVLARAVATAASRTAYIYVETATNATPGVYIRGNHETWNRSLNNGSEMVTGIFRDGSRVGVVLPEGFVFKETGSASESTNENILLGARTESGPTNFLAGNVYQVVITDAFDAEQMFRLNSWMRGAAVNAFADPTGGASAGPPTLTGISASGITSSGATLTITAS